MSSIARPALISFCFAAYLCAAESDKWQSVSPILQSNCASCHSEKTKTSGFSVGTATAVIAGGNKHGKAVIEGHPDQSPLIRILKGELAPRMPMGKSLSDAEINLIAGWIRGLPPSKLVSSTELALAI